MELTKLTVCQAANKIRKKEISVPELTHAYLDRINELNKKIGAYITVCGQEAEKQADRVQKKIDNYEELPIIAGIPAKSKTLLFKLSFLNYYIITETRATFTIHTKYTAGDSGVFGDARRHAPTPFCYQATVFPLQI